MHRARILALSAATLIAQTPNQPSRSFGGSEFHQQGTVAGLQANDNDPELPKLLCRMALYAQPGIVDAAAAEKLVRHGLTLLSQNNARETADAAVCLTTLARVLESLGKVKQSQQELEHALAIREGALGPNHLLVAETLNLLGLAHYHQGHMSEAERAYGRAVEILRKQAPSADLAAALSNLSNSMSAQGRLKEGEERTREALSIWETLGGPDDPSVAVGLTNLAVLLEAHKKYDEAGLLLNRALRIDEKKYPSNHPRIGMDLNAAGVLAMSRKNYPEAEDLLVRAATIVEKALSPQDPERGQVLLNLGDVYRLEKKMSQAADAFKRDLTVVMTTWDPNDTRLPTWMDKLVLVLKAQEDYAAAEELEIRATRIRVTHGLR
jgi:tetratricopeptide (TPR) repeat protein